MVRGVRARRRSRWWLAAVLLAATVPTPLFSRDAARAGQATPQPIQAAAIVAIAERAMADYDLRAVILRVEIGGEEIVTAALGESLTGVPATIDMHFRNGAVAISYMATVLLQLVDEGVVTLDDPIATWLPDLPDADRVTLRMLANMTAGYPDYILSGDAVERLYENPFRAWTPRELIDSGLAAPRRFVPGANWDYSHTNYVILGLALEAIAGQPLNALIQKRILDPLGLDHTAASITAAIPEPVLHAYTSERRRALGIPAGTPLYEESTFWDPSWTLAHGAIETTTIADMTAAAVAIGEGTLLSPESHAAQIDPVLRGFGAPLEGCPTCHTVGETYTYGLGVVLRGDWILQNPLFGGYGAVAAYLPDEEIAIAVATTYGEAAFDDEGNYRHGNASEAIFRAIAEYLAPGSVPAAS
jgi:CubicO group peptidase (beta-lactamase class C family)